MEAEKDRSLASHLNHAAARSGGVHSLCTSGCMSKEIWPGNAPSSIDDNGWSPRCVSPAFQYIMSTNRACVRRGAPTADEILRLCD